MDNMYKFTLTEQEANIILNALTYRPYIEVVELIEKIHQQAQENIVKEGENE